MPMPDPALGKVVSLFSHLPQYIPESSTQREKNAKGSIHPVVITLGVQYSENVITGGNARCLALVLALSRVIADYETPEGTLLHRHLTQHVSKQVDFLNNTRVLASSMKTAIRFIKNEIATLDFSLSDEDVGLEFNDRPRNDYGIRLRSL